MTFPAKVISLPPAMTERIVAPEGRSLPAAEVADRRALVRCIAASPVHMGWLRDHVAAILEREAHQLDALGDAEGADHLRRRARAHMLGETPLW